MMNFDLTESFRKAAEEAREDLKLTGDLEQDRYAIKDDGAANYFLQKYKEGKDKINSINSFADDEIENHTNTVNKWRNDEVQKVENNLEYIGTLLEEYTRTKLENSKSKSHSLPYGTLRIKKQQRKYVYDEKKLMEWLKENELGKEYIKVAVKTTESIDKTKLKKDASINNDNTLSLNGCEIDGVYTQDIEDKFEIL